MRLRLLLPVAAALALSACGEQPTPKPPLPSKPAPQLGAAVVPPAPVVQTPACVPRPAVVCPSAKPPATVVKVSGHRHRSGARHAARRGHVVRKGGEERTYARVHTEDRASGYREGGRYERHDESYSEEGYSEEGYRDGRGPPAGYRSEYYAYGDSGAAVHYADRYGWEHREGYAEGYRRGAGQGGPDRHGPGGPPHRPPPPPPRDGAAGRDDYGFLTWPGKVPAAPPY